jgi:hypothetical protein
VQLMLRPLFKTYQPFYKKVVRMDMSLAKEDS